MKKAITGLLFVLMLVGLVSMLGCGYAPLGGQLNGTWEGQGWYEGVTVTVRGSNATIIDGDESLSVTFAIIDDSIELLCSCCETLDVINFEFIPSTLGQDHLIIDGIAFQRQP